jgi:hypothetical protein
MPPVLASGEILKKGTAVVTTFIFSCANTVVVKEKSRIPKLNFRAVDLIAKSLKLERKYSGFKKFVLKYWIRRNIKE